MTSSSPDLLPFKSRFKKMGAEIGALVLCISVIWTLGAVLDLWPWYPQSPQQTATLFIASPIHDNIQIYDKHGLTSQTISKPKLFSGVQTLSSGDTIFVLNKEQQDDPTLWVKANDVIVCGAISEQDLRGLRHALKSAEDMLYSRNFLFLQEATLTFISPDPDPSGCNGDSHILYVRYQCRDNIPYRIE